jgi:hypothetical protein
MAEKILHLTLRKKWFDLILSGEKKEEYRECKDYWIIRLLSDYGKYARIEDYKHFDFVKFTNGYAKNSPCIVFKCEGIHTGFGNPDWGAEDGKEYFVIRIGERYPRSFLTNQ